MADDHLALAQEFIGNTHAFAQQTSGVLPQVKNQPFQLPKLVERARNFLLGGFLEAGNVHVADARADHEMQVHAEARNLVAGHVEIQRLLQAFAENGDLDRGALGALQKFGDFAGAQVVSRFAVNREDDVAGTNPGAVRGRAHEGRNHDDLVITRPDLHAHDVVLAALLFAQQGVRLGIKEIGVRIQHAQHAGDGSVVNSLLGVDGLGVILLNHLVHLGKGAEAVVEVGDSCCGGASADLLPEQGSGKTAKNNDYGNKKE